MKKSMKILAACVSLFCITGCSEQMKTETTTATKANVTTIIVSESVTEIPETPISDSKIMLDGNLCEIASDEPIDFIFNRDGKYMSIYGWESNYADLFDSKNLIGKTKRVSDSSEITGNFETDFYDGVGVYSDGKSAMILMESGKYMGYLDEEIEQLKILCENNPDEYQQQLDSGALSVEELQSADIWYAFSIDEGRVICYDYYGSAVDVTELKDNIFVGDTRITVDDYVYAVISDGQGWDSQTSPEFFEQEVFDARIANQDDYTKIFVNDTFGDLVLRHTETAYAYNPYKNEVWITASSATFDGELSMDGYVTLDADDSILFLPKPGEWKRLPMIYYDDRSSLSDDNYEVCSNAPIISLGKMEDYIDSDFTITVDKSLRRAHITFDNLTLFWLDSNFGGGRSFAKLVDFLLDK